MIKNFEEMKHPADLKDLEDWQFKIIRSLVLTTSIYKPNYSNLEYALEPEQQILPFKRAYDMQLPETTMTLHSVGRIAASKENHTIPRLISVFLIEQDNKKRYFIKGTECSKVQFYDTIPELKSILAPIEERIAMIKSISDAYTNKVIKL